MKTEGMVETITLEEFWNPEERGEQIEGVVVEKREEVGKYKSSLYKLENDSKIHCIWGSLKRDELMKPVHMGDYVIIRYMGIIKTNKYTMKNFSLEIVLD